jgi:cell division transport system ATP-binding protein
LHLTGQFDKKPPLNWKKPVTGFSEGSEQEKLETALLELGPDLPVSPVQVKSKLPVSRQGADTGCMTDLAKKKAIIRLFHVHKRYGTKSALTDISLDIYRNDMVTITGPSGAGKSTLLKLLYFGESASQGQILVDGVNLSRINPTRIPFLRRKFGIIFQDYKLIPTKTVFENIALVLEVAGHKSPQIQKRVQSVLRVVGMEERPHAYPPTLSGGEQQRIAVARAVVGNPKLILADEPTGSLDAEASNAIVNLIKKFHGAGATVIIATHDQMVINKVGGRMVSLTAGRLTAPQAASPPGDASQGKLTEN